MKKTIAIILVLGLTLTLFACGKDVSSTEADASPGESTSTDAAPSPSASDSAEPFPGAGTATDLMFDAFDPSVDYSKNENYKVVYMVGSVTSLSQSFSDAFDMWASRTNCTYNIYSANGDADIFINSIEVFAEQEYDGFILDPEITIYQRVADVCNELGLNWIPGMGAFKDEEGKLEHPCVGFDNTQFGADMADWLIDYAKNNFKDFDPSITGFISLDFSAVSQIHERTTGAQSVWNGAFPGYEKNFFTGDGVTIGQLTAEAGFNLAAPIMSANTNIKFWLIAACADDYADGAARAAESLSMQDSTICTTIGGTLLVSHWDAGEDSCWKSALYTANVLYTEAIFMGLYAIMNKDATPETLWPAWINKSGGEKYASLLLPSQILLKDNYQEYMEFVDQYAGTNAFDYEYGGTTYSTRLNPPDSFAG